MTVQREQIKDLTYGFIDFTDFLLQMEGKWKQKTDSDTLEDFKNMRLLFRGDVNKDIRPSSTEVCDWTHWAVC